MVKASSPKTLRIDLEKIDPPGAQVRLEINKDAVEELAESIKAVGQLQAILVRPVDGRYEIVFGHRRWLACSLLNWKKMRAEVKDLDDQQVALMRATENVARQDLSPVEEAAVYEDLRKTHGLTIDDVGRLMGKKPGIVRRRLDLLKMPPVLQKAVHDKQIGYGVAEDLWSLGDINAINYYLPFAIENGATVAVVRGWVKEWRDARRRESSDVEGGGGVQSPMEPRPVFVPCDLCQGPMKLGEETVIRSCPVCTKLINDGMKGA